MFFNNDILFNAGPLAIAWKAGNGDFSTKESRSRKNKHYLLMLNVRVGQACDELRKLFPQMGSAYGLSLKKASILVKGLGVIYVSQMDHLMRSMHETHLRMKMASIRSLKAIDLPTSPAAHGREPVGGKPDLVSAVALGFGDLCDAASVAGDGPRFFRGNEEALPPPPVSSAEEDEQEESRRKTKKRKCTEEGEVVDVQDDDVLRCLREHYERNKRAFTLPEAEETELPTRPQYPEGEFDILAPGDFDGFGPTAEFQEFGAPPMAMLSPRLLSPSGRRGTQAELGQGRYPGTRRSPFEAEEIPTGDIYGIQEGAVPAIQVQAPQDEGSMELGPLILERGRGRGRRGRQLRVDKETQLPMSVIHQQVTEQARPFPSGEIGRNLAETFRKNIIKLKHDIHVRGMAWIIVSGRKVIGNGAREFTRELGKETMDFGRRQEPLRNLQQTAEGGLRAISSSQPPEGSAFPIAPGSTLGQPLPPTFREPETWGVAFGMEEQQPVNEELAGGYHPSPVREQPARSRETSPAPTPSEGPHPGIESIGADKVAFSELFPSALVSRRKAAVGFFQLLRLQATGKVLLEQKEAFGEIYINKLDANNSE